MKLNPVNLISTACTNASTLATTAVMGSFQLILVLQGERVYVENPAAIMLKDKAIWWQLVLGKRPLWTIARVLLLVVTALILFKLVLLPVRITGASMEPTCYNGQIGFINQLAYHWRPPRRGEIIGFRPDNRGPIIVKRIIGLPGERIAFHSGTVFINGQALAEPYLDAKGSWEWPEETLAKQTYFVTGDNRTLSMQFRVEQHTILGKLHFWRL